MQQDRGRLRIVPVPLLSDNYGYLLIAKDGTTAAVDPVEPKKMLAAAAKEGVSITCVLTTHNHPDHAGGNVGMRDQVRDLMVVGGAEDAVAACTRPVSDGDTLQLGNVSIRCIHTPYHTQGHICYFCGDTEDKAASPAVFTGDSLFVAGSGRLSAEAGVPTGETEVFCGHEYTVTNLEFAATADSSNAPLHRKLEWAHRQREAGTATVPSTIAEELSYNPFLRTSDAKIAAWCQVGDDPVAILAKLRSAKDNFGLTARLITGVLAVASAASSAAKAIGLR